MNNTTSLVAINYGAVETNPAQPQDRNAPPDVSINTIAEWMRHYPKWRNALVQRISELEGCDLWALKFRASVIEDSDRYPPAARERVKEALSEAQYIADLEAAVLEAERERRRERRKERKLSQSAAAA